MSLQRCETLTENYLATRPDFSMWAGLTGVCRGFSSGPRQQIMQCELVGVPRHTALGFTGAVPPERMQKRCTWQRGKQCLLCDSAPTGSKTIGRYAVGLLELIFFHYISALLNRFRGSRLCGRSSRQPECLPDPLGPWAKAHNCRLPSRVGCFPRPGEPHQGDLKPIHFHLSPLKRKILSQSELSFIPIVFRDTYYINKALC